jgi:DNA-directed RNA polymerase subunit M/transcription elongation factor TFIIS
MDCPECGGRLVDYRLGDREAMACEDCGYVGIDAEHRGRSPPRESWNDAVERFRRQRGDTTDEHARGETPGDEGEPDAEAGQESEGPVEETDEGGSDRERDEASAEDGESDEASAEGGESDESSAEDGESDESGAEDSESDESGADDDTTYLPAVGPPAERPENGTADEE